MKPATKNLEAYELYLKGRHLCAQRLTSTVRLGMKYFEQAIELDPQFALAYSGLADCYCILRVYGWISHEEGKPPALAAVTKAAALAPELSEVNFSRGFFAFYFVSNWRESGPHFQKAIAINPRSSSRMRTMPCSWPWTDARRRRLCMWRCLPIGSSGPLHARHYGLRLSSVGAF